jgi:hypothetical protein
MKNFEQILSDAGVELTDEQKATITKEMGENYKTIADWQKQHDKVQNLTEQLDSTKEALKKFDGVDADALNKQIAELNDELKNKETEYQNQIADRDFQDMLKDSIASAKGKNAKAITALLDLETLKASKNQKEDIAAALKTLTEAEDSKMLFGDSEPDVVGKGDPIGAVTKNNGSGDAWLNQMMAAAGISESNNDK